MKTYLEKLINRQDLSVAETEAAFEALTSGKVAHSQIGAFLTALNMKGVTFEELTGAARMMRRHATFIDTAQQEVVDVVGTGGDKSNTFNISTTSCFVAAGAGVPMAKHGNRAATSKCGAADVLAAVGVNLDAPPEAVEAGIAEHGIGFLFAAKMHPLMGRMRLIRSELGIPTVFNLLGPLINPAGAKRQVLGVYAPHLTELFASTLRELGSKQAMVVHGMDCLDEISCCAPTRVTELYDGEIRTYELLPELYVGETFDKSELAGGEPAENATILQDILSGKERGAKRAVTLLNAGAVIYVSGRAENLREGVNLAAESIDSGKAMAKLQTLIEVTNGGY